LRGPDTRDIPENKDRERKERKGEGEGEGLDEVEIKG
jgi:hypothetical protein